MTLLAEVPMTLSRTSVMEEVDFDMMFTDERGSCVGAIQRRCIVVGDAMVASGIG